jgi:PEP-CTERM motif
MNLPFDALNTQISQLPFASSNIDNQNPISGGIQGTAFGAFPGGVQQRFGVGSFGTFGAAGSVEAALDLYRIQARNNIAGQFGLGDPVRVGDYLGTVTINGAGDVAYIVVPEPTTFALMGMGVVGMLVARRRKQIA